MRCLPPTRTVVEFQFTRLSETIWLLVERCTMSVCVQHPGGDVDLVTSATARTFAQVFLGRRRWHDAVGSGDIVLSGLSPAGTGLEAAGGGVL